MVGNDDARRYDHLPDLDPEVEEQERCGDLVLREARFTQHCSEPKSVQ